MTELLPSEAFQTPVEISSVHTDMEPGLERFRARLLANLLPQENS